MSKKQEPPSIPETLTVIMIDRVRTAASIIHEGECLPHGRRTVQIKLTEEQRRELTPRDLGLSSGRMQYEEVRECWLEPAAGAPPIPKTLTTMMIDRFRTEISVIHEGECLPHGRRTVQIKLTEEQRRELTPQELGWSDGHVAYEGIRECWLEPPAEDALVEQP